MKIDPAILASPELSISLAELNAEVLKLSDRLAKFPSAAIVAVQSADPLLNSLALLASEKSQRSLVFFRPGFEKTFVEDQIEKLQVSACLTGKWDSYVVHETKFSGSFWRETHVGIYTSGTTGLPKLAWHSLGNLKAPSHHVPERLRGKKWMTSYNPTAYAGIQVFFAALASGGSLAFPGSLLSDHPQFLVDQKVEVLSATPTYWKMLIQSWPASLPQPRLLQASLGGEAVRQDVLDAIQKSFSPDKITHIYASTEAGTAIVVSDGREGFPVSEFDRAGAVRVRVQEGYLEIATQKGMQGYAGQKGDPATWYRTPDRVEIRGDRAYFLGREDGIINVGGNKVSPEEVELILNSMDPIQDSHVYGKSSPITGMILCADLVIRSGSEFQAEAIKGKLKERLPAYQIPRVLKVVEKIRMSENGKKIRQSS